MASARPWALVIECAHASHAYGVFLLLTVTDVLLASHVLPTTAAAVYAAGSVVTKGTLWLPQSLASVLFASMTDADRHRGLFLRGAGAIATLGVIVTIGCWLLGPMVTFIVAGAKYPQLHSDLYLFAMLGSCLALTQFALVTGLAIRSRRVTTLVWASIATEALFVLVLNRDGGVRGIVTAVATINLVAAGLAVVLRVAAPRISGRRRPSSARTQCSLPSEH